MSTLEPTGALTIPQQFGAVFNQRLKCSFVSVTACFLFWDYEVLYLPKAELHWSLWVIIAELWTGARDLSSSFWRNSAFSSTEVICHTS